MAKHTNYLLQMTADELSILFAVFCTGRVGGNPAVRSKLYDKIAGLNKAMRLGNQGDPIDGEVTERRKSSDLISKDAV